ncbi:hypothetical protein [Bordetella petrii]|uniref:hypothetical protein n=1 Tax=Bordetella petrii TaxID=94624 RepID=UPI00048EDF36|nr:hypothetical protein [Bordetella petrii]
MQDWDNDDLLVFAKELAANTREYKQPPHLRVEQLRLRSADGVSDDTLKRLLAICDSVVASIRLDDDEMTMVAKTEQWISRVTEAYARSTKENGWQYDNKADSPWNDREINELGYKIYRTPLGNEQTAYWNALVAHTMRTTTPWLALTADHSGIYTQSQFGGEFRAFDVLQLVTHTIMASSGAGLVQQLVSMLNATDGSEQSTTAKSLFDQSWSYKTSANRASDMAICPIVNDGGLLRMGVVGVDLKESETRWEVLVAKYFSGGQSVIGRGVAAHFDIDSWRKNSAAIIKKLDKYDSDIISSVEL